MIYLNNKLVPDAKATVSVFDHGFLYGDGIYETLRAYNSKVFMIDEHVKRLFRSASLISLDIKKTPSAIKKIVYETLKANRLKEAVIRITVSRGAGPTGLDPALCRKPTFAVFARKFKDYPPSYYRKGIKLSIVNTRRNYIRALDPQIKSLNFLNNILAKIESKEHSSQEALMLNYRGYLAEGTVSNVFFVRNKTLHTPSLKVGILNGITRQIILETARELKIPTKEGCYRPADIYNANEVFISNSTMEVMPVASVDSVSFKPGTSSSSITRNLHNRYRDKVAEYQKRNK